MAKAEARMLTTSRDRESARLYLVIMRESNLEGWHTHHAMERTYNELKARIEGGDMDESERWELEKRISVMSAFVNKVNAQRRAAMAKRIDKHIHGRAPVPTDVKVRMDELR